jgi:hypothetical protein
LVQEARDRSMRTLPLDAFLAERAADFAAGCTLVDHSRRVNAHDHASFADARLFRQARD